MLVSYAVLGFGFVWSANQTSGNFAGITFMATLALSWLPLYVYLNRQDILNHPDYWLSQGAALLVTAVAALGISFVITDDKPTADSTAFAVGAITYVLSSIYMGGFLEWLFKTVEAKVATKAQPTEKPTASK